METPIPFPHLPSSWLQGKLLCWTWKFFVFINVPSSLLNRNAPINCTEYAFTCERTEARRCHVRFTIKTGGSIWTLCGVHAPIFFATWYPAARIGHSLSAAVLLLMAVPSSELIHPTLQTMSLYTPSPAQLRGVLKSRDLLLRLETAGPWDIAKWFLWVQELTANDVKF